MPYHMSARCLCPAHIALRDAIAVNVPDPNDAPNALWTVGAVAEATGVSVRTLHHYDEIALLCPSVRSPAGYRLYAAEDVARLEEILLYRRLGFSLEQTAQVLAAAPEDLTAHLADKLDLLKRERDAIDADIQSITSLLDQLKRGAPMTTDDLHNALDGLSHAPEPIRDDYAKHHGEVQARWGDTDTYAAAETRIRGHSKKDWARIQGEQERLEAAMARLAGEGIDASSDEACALAEQMRQHIDRSYYACSREMHVALADMYESDPRFRAHYDNRKAGLAAYIATAIRTNAAAAS